MDVRARASDDTRPTPPGPIQPSPGRAGARERAEPEDRARSERGSGVGADRLQRLRDQIASGTYTPPVDDVAERLAGFFVTDRPYLPRRHEDG
jgi:hypothetical protein